MSLADEHSAVLNAVEDASRRLRRVAGGGRAGLTGQGQHRKITSCCLIQYPHPIGTRSGQIQPRNREAVGLDGAASVLTAAEHMP